MSLSSSTESVFSRVDSSSTHIIVAHAIFSVIGFLIFLPFGSLLARYLRTFSPKWFAGHWISQFALAGITILVGLSLGFQSASQNTGKHFDTTHKKCGVALFVVYLIQCAGGAFIHWVKPKQATRRPNRNYVHAVLGIVIIAVSFYEVRIGYKTEWPTATGRGAVGGGADIVWYIWVVVVPVAYSVGLVFIPKQYRQEAEGRKGILNGSGERTDGNMANVQLLDTTRGSRV